jgi:FKBP12-rapamycin complex-associated protein
MLHIDFGDCFEASMMRDKFPEKVPFRLTRMMVRAMEVAGIEGNFRATCDEVMRVMRSQRDSMMAMLEAFVHDPLINWRLLNADNVGEGAADATSENPAEVPLIPEGVAASLPRQAYTREQVLDAYGGIGGDPSEALNDRAVQVMKRISDKLTGRDGARREDTGFMESDSVKRQVRRLIQQATSHENLCQSYIGWCPWW